MDVTLRHGSNVALASLVRWSEIRLPVAGDRFVVAQLEWVREREALAKEGMGMPRRRDGREETTATERQRAYRSGEGSQSVLVLVLGR